VLANGEILEHARVKASVKRALIKPVGTNVVHKPAEAIAHGVIAKTKECAFPLQSQPVAAESAEKSGVSPIVLGRIFVI